MYATGSVLMDDFEIKKGLACIITSMLSNLYDA